MNIAPFVAILRAPSLALSPRLASFIEGAKRAAALEPLFAGPGIDVFGSAAGDHFISDDGGTLVWGVLFDRPSHRRAEALPSTVPAERFVRDYWGGYLRFSAAGGASEALRDPSGSIPCYHLALDGADILTSRPDLLFALGLVRPQIDWTIVTQALVYRDQRPARTALRGIAELMPGTALEMDACGTRVRTIWTPWDFAARDSEIVTFEHGVEQVRREILNCAGAWARCYRRPLLELSGGLDSSIVAAVVAEAGRDAICVTFAPAPGDPDETPYAQAVAAHLGLELRIVQAEPGDIALPWSQARDLPRPCARGFAQALDLKLRAVAQESGADSFFSGGGGDNIFGYLQSVLPLIDRLRREPGFPALGTASDIAALAGVSVGEVLARTLARAVRGPPRHWLPDPRLLDPAVLGDLPYPQGHPWIPAPPSTLPGKRVHGRAMIAIQNHLEGFDRLHDAPIISPLLSQPLVERCMAIPSWLWCRGGQNRAIAREAFRDRLPAPVIDRRSKGAFDAYCAKIFHLHRQVLRELLLGGMLAERRIIDCGAIEALLDRGDPQRADMLRLLDLADAEAWARAWCAERPPC